MHRHERSCDQIDEDTSVRPSLLRRLLARVERVIALLRGSDRRRLLAAGRARPGSPDANTVSPDFEATRLAARESERVDHDAWYYSSHPGAGIDIEEQPLESLPAEFRDELSAQVARRGKPG
jgi:hypothetical protein